MAVGVALAGALCATSGVTIAEALTLALGIGIQNFPEGAIISMPLQSAGMKKGKAFLIGVLSGVVEPIFAALTIALAGLVVPILPYLLSFAAGAMVYVVVAELVPEMIDDPKSSLGILAFALGFTVMLSLDVAL